MQLKYTQGLLNFIFTMFALVVSKVVVAQPRSRFIVVHPVTMDPFNGIVSIADAQPSTLLRVKKNTFTAADLTPAEADKVKKKVKPANGILAPNNPILVDDSTSTSGVSILQQNAGVPGDLPMLDNWLTTTPLCTTSLDNVDIVVLDTVPFRNITEFDNVTIIDGPIYVNSSQPCNSHATQIISLLVGNTLGVIPNGDRSIYSISAYGCNGFGAPEDIIAGIHEAVRFAGTNQQNGRRTVVMLSIVTGVNAAVDAALSIFELSGIPAFIAAGNSGVKICASKKTPANKPYTIASTTPPGNIRAPFTNFGAPCVDMFLPGVNLPVATISNNFSTTLVSGTAYSAALATALGAMELGLDPIATPAEVYQRISATPRTQILQSDTAVLTVMLNNNACPYNRLFNAYVAAKKTSNQFNAWIDAAIQNQLCVSFAVRANNGAVLVGLRTDPLDSAFIKITLDKPVKKGYRHTIEQNGVTLATSVTAASIVKQKRSTIWTIQANGTDIAVWYAAATNTNPKQLLFTSQANAVQQIAFSSSGGQASFANALKLQCT